VHSDNRGDGNDCLAHARCTSGCRCMIDMQCLCWLTMQILLPIDIDVQLRRREWLHPTLVPR
jgi:hypothetical protein